MPIQNEQTDNVILSFYRKAVIMIDDTSSESDEEMLELEELKDQKLIIFSGLMANLWTDFVYSKTPFSLLLV